MPRSSMVGLPFIVGSVLTVFGCNNGSATPPAQGETAHSEQTKSDATEKIAKALASLSEIDRKAAIEQGVCPVSGEPLGSMGAPIKVHVKNRDVFICCAGCEDDIKKSPDEYLAKLTPPVRDDSKR
jgi:hypothetical protein